MNKLVHMLPFMESNELKDLAIKIINKEVKGVRIVVLFPFLSGKDLNEVVDLMIEKKMGRELNKVIPFINEEKLNELYDAVKDGSIEGLEETYLFPFLGKDKLKSMFNDLVKKATEEADDEQEEDDEE